MICNFDFSSSKKDWKRLYRNGQKGKTVLAKRISDAQHAIFLRGREIFYAGTPRTEGSS